MRALPYCGSSAGHRSPLPNKQQLMLGFAAWFSIQLTKRQRKWQNTAKDSKSWTKTTEQTERGTKFRRRFKDNN